MANTSKKKMTATAKKSAAAKAETVKKETKSEEVKSIAVKPEAKKLTTAKEPKKITAAKEPEKITVAKEPEKLTVKEEPKKTVKKETKAETKSTKAETKSAKTVKKEETKTVKAAKKETPATKKSVKEEPKKEETPVKKSTKKAETKKVEAKEEKKSAVKKTETVNEKKPAAKKAAKKPTKKEKTAVYEVLSLEECIQRMQAMGVQHVYEDYARFLMDEADIKKLEKDIIEGNNLKNADFAYEKDGYDTDLVAVTLGKVADTMDIKAMDYKDIKKDMNTAVKTTISEDAEVNAAEYLKEFKICEKLLMIGQRKNIGDSAIVSELIGAEVDAFVAHFFDLAYAILPDWQYDDVKFYEDFAYAVLSQYYDLFTKYQLRILMDVADLYIKHGDFQHGDECYGYILRDNQIKDYIYYRFASVYEDIDFNKAKALAYESLQYVDGRYTYYQNIMDIINK